MLSGRCRNMGEDLIKEGITFLEKLSGTIGMKLSWYYRRGDLHTSPAYGYPPWRRPLQIYVDLGVINLDKPPGPTSHEVVAWIKKMLNLEKAGHSGTLEPA